MARRNATAKQSATTSPIFEARRYLIDGFRPGTKFLTTAGTFVNGERIRHSEIEAELRKRYVLRAVEDGTEFGIQRPDPKEIAAANTELGLNTLSNGKSALQNDIDAHLREVMAPLKKATHLFTD